MMRAFQGESQLAVWSSGMILRLGRRGPGFESLNGPSLAFSKTFNNENKDCPPSSLAFLAQWLERLAVNRKVAGSIPVVGGFATAITFCHYSEHNRTKYTL